MNTIFVQIASYRDPELIPTIKDCIAKAKNPENLSFGICWQYGPEEEHIKEELNSFANIKIIEVPYIESKGLCWARSLIQKLWKGEKYTLQIDSHHRFLQNWDDELIKMMDMVPSEKPLLTSYAGMYNVSENRLLNVEPYKMVADRFTETGTILFYPHIIENWENLTSPIPARFVSGHFFFTIGKHCEEYKYDPNLYFAGDEISLSIRSYTLGYDLYHPHKTVIWHEYTREGRTKHWTDFNQVNKDKGAIEKTWWEMDIESKQRLRHMLKEEDNNIDLEEYGLGNVRTHADYEAYAGINFKKRILHPKTKQGLNPPINDLSDWSTLFESEYSLNLKLPDIGNKVYKNLYIGIENQEGHVLFRVDLKEYQPEFNANFKSIHKPYKWVFWPINMQGEWCDRVDTLIK